MLLAPHMHQDMRSCLQVVLLHSDNMRMLFLQQECIARCLEHSISSTPVTGHADAQVLICVNTWKRAICGIYIATWDRV
jgi:hypothetical protein